MAGLRQYLRLYWAVLSSELSRFLTGQQVILSFLLAVTAVFVQYLRGALTLEVTKENLASAICPFVWIVSAFALWYVLKSYRIVNKKLIEELETSRPKLHIPVGTALPTIRTPKFGILIVVAFVALPIMSSILAFRAAFPNGRMTTATDRPKQPIPTPAPETPKEAPRSRPTDHAKRQHPPEPREPRIRIKSHEPVMYRDRLPTLIRLFVINKKEPIRFAMRATAAVVKRTVIEDAAKQRQVEEYLWQTYVTRGERSAVGLLPTSDGNYSVLLEVRKYLRESLAENIRNGDVLYALGILEAEDGTRLSEFCVYSLPDYQTLAVCQAHNADY